jgi:hypothetical protein
LLRKAISCRRRRIVSMLNVSVDLDVERHGQRVDHRDADAVQSAGHRVGVAVELAARVEHRQHHLDGGLLLHRVHADRDAAAVVGDADATVVLQHDLDTGGVTRHRLVDGVVHDLPDQVVQTAFARGPDVHAGALANRLQPLEHSDGRCAVGVLLLRHGLTVSSPRRPDADAKTPPLRSLSTGRSGCARKHTSHHTGASGQKPG